MSAVCLIAKVISAARPKASVYCAVTGNAVAYSVRIKMIKYAK